jgi:hypothetical protein
MFDDDCDAGAGAWTATAAIHAAFAQNPVTRSDAIARDGPAIPLAARCIANGDEHAIKFTEACLREHALQPSPAYIDAVQRVLEPQAGL